MPIYLEDFLKTNNVDLEKISKDIETQDTFKNHPNTYWFDILAKRGYQGIINGDLKDTNHIVFHYLRQDWVEKSKGKEVFYNKYTRFRDLINEGLLTPYEAIISVYEDFETFYKSGDLDVAKMIRKEINNA